MHMKEKKRLFALCKKHVNWNHLLSYTTVKTLHILVRREIGVERWKTPSTLCCPHWEWRWKGHCFLDSGRAKTLFPDVIARDVKHWWEASFNWGLLKSEWLLDTLNAEVGNKKEENSEECLTVHKDGLKVFESSALSASALGAAEWAKNEHLKSWQCRMRNTYSSRFILWQIWLEKM